MTIDLTEVKTIIVLIASLITSLGVICAFLKKLMDKAVDKIIDKSVDKITEPILAKVEKMNEPILQKIDDLKADHCKDHILNALNDIENGIHKNEYDLARLYELYKYYTKELKLNSYVHKRWKEVIGEDEV